MTTYVRCGTLFTGDQTATRSDAVLGFDDTGIINFVCDTADAPPVGTHDTVLDYSGLFVMPGLLDVHTHLAYGNAKSEEDIDLYQPMEFRALRGLFFAQKVVAAGYIGPEPVNVLLQLVEQTVPLPDGGSFTPARPSVREDAFRPRNGTTLELASFSQDLLVHAEDLALLYPYLTGDDRGRLYDAVVGDDAVHSMFVADPDGVLDELHWP